MPRKLETEVVVVGAGPVGLLAALALKRAGVEVQVFDSNRRTGVHSYASVLHADSLRLLDRFGLLAGVLAHGIAITKVGLYEGATRRAEIDVAGLPESPKHLVVLPQSRLESILEDALAALGSHVQWQHRVQDLDARADGVHMTVAKLDSVSTGYPIARSEQVVAKTFDVSCAYVVGADGYDSFVRRRLVVDFEDLGGRQIMSVYQCEVDGKLPQEGRFMFSMLGVGAYWPLQGGRCRLSFPVASEAGHRPDAAGLAAHLAEHAPWFDNEIRSLEWTATASFERRLAATFGRDRVWLAGDSAHLTWPAGAQSMNVGLRESADLAERIAQVSRRAAAASTLADYGTSQRAEWRRLLGSGAKLGRRAQDWTADHAARLLSSVPASGRDLGILLGQLGVEVGPG